MSEMGGKAWSANQIRVQEWLALPRYERIPPTQERLADDLGISDKTITRWKQLPGFQDEVNAMARRAVGGKLPEVYGALLREAEKGSFQHIQLVLELTGEYVKTQRNEYSGSLDVRSLSDDELRAIVEG